MENDENQMETKIMNNTKLWLAKKFTGLLPC